MGLLLFLFLCKDTEKYLTWCIFYRIIFISSIKNIKISPVLQYLLYLCNYKLLIDYEKRR